MKENFCSKKNLLASTKSELCRSRLTATCCSGRSFEFGPPKIWTSMFTNYRQSKHNLLNPLLPWTAWLPEKALKSSKERLECVGLQNICKCVFSELLIQGFFMNTSSRLVRFSQTEIKDSFCDTSSWSKVQYTLWRHLYSSGKSGAKWYMPHK